MNTIRYVVEWMPSASVTEKGNPDSGKVRRATRQTFAAAEQFAWSVLPDDYWGCVSIEEQVYRVDAEIEAIEGRIVNRWCFIREWAVSLQNEPAELVDY